jgi:hypothetical protein
MDVGVEIQIRAERLDGGDHAGEGPPLAGLQGEGAPRRLAGRLAPSDCI